MGLFNKSTIDISSEELTKRQADAASKSVRTLSEIRKESGDDNQDNLRGIYLYQDLTVKTMRGACFQNNNGDYVALDLPKYFKGGEKTGTDITSRIENENIVVGYFPDNPKSKEIMQAAYNKYTEFEKSQEIIKATNQKGDVIADKSQSYSLDFDKM